MMKQPIKIVKDMVEKYPNDMIHGIEFVGI